MQKYLSFLMAVVLLVGCSTRAVITSQPRGATVFIDEEIVGQTPYYHEETRRFLGIGTTKLALSAEGYRDVVRKLDQDFNLLKGSTSIVLGVLSYIVGGYGIGLIFLPWDFTLDPHYDFILQPQGQQSTCEEKGTPVRQERHAPIPQK